MTASKKNKSTIGIVVEVFNHDKAHLIIVVRAYNAKSHCFFYIKNNPEVELGDVIQIKLSGDKIFVIRRISDRPFKRFELKLLTWPGTLLMETMSERLGL